MIVITSERTDRTWQMCPGDKFVLGMGERTTFTSVGGRFTSSNEVLSEEIDKEIEINYICIFRFARNDGFCISPHAAGFFGQQHDLPEELVSAKRYDELTKDQQKKFRESCGYSV